MPLLIDLRVVAKILLVCFLCWVLGSCSQTPPTIPTFVLEDKAGLVSPKVQMDIKRSVDLIQGTSKLNLAILTVPGIASTEPSGFADDAFGASPKFGLLLTGDKAKDGDNPAAKRDAWSGRGILICASTNPRLVFIRVGVDYQRLFPDSVLHVLLEQRVYPLLMKKRLRDGLKEAVSLVAERIKAHPEMAQEPGSFGKAVQTFLLRLKNFSFPSWSLYYYLTVKPLLNSLILTMKATGYSVWGVFLWLVALSFITKHDLLKKICQKFNWGLLKRSGLLKMWLLLGENSKNPRAPIEIKDLKGKLLLKIDVSQAQFETVKVRMSALDRHVPFISSIEASILKIGLGLPVWACLSLITLPYWENILTMRSHLADWIQQDLPSHSVFVLQNGFLWWTKPTEASGCLFALVFAFFYALSVIPGVIMNFMIGEMETEQVVQLGISEAAHLLTKWSNEDSNSKNSAFGKLILFPCAVAFLPFLLGFYLLCVYVVEGISAISGLLKFLRRVRALKANPLPARPLF